MMQQPRGFGWLKQPQDARDFKLWLPSDVTILPTVDLRHTTAQPPIYDQGQLGSCTANAIAAAYEYNQRSQNEPDFTPSRLAIYYAERELEHSVRQDAGAFIRDGFKVLAKRGVGDEQAWPYDISKFAHSPGTHFWQIAKKHKSLVYSQPTKTLDGLKAALSVGFPFVFGFNVYQSFESIAANGLMPDPQQGEAIIGGHAVMCVGYWQDWFIVRNSWGPGWGDAGYFYVHQAFMLGNDTDDFWTLEKVT